MKKSSKLSLFIFIVFLCFAIGIFGWQVLQSVSDGIDLGNIFQTNDRETVEISIVYAPESDLYLPEVIEEFNESYSRGVNPVTGEKLSSEDKQIVVTGEPGSSGTVRSKIVNAVKGRTQDIAKPTIFAPSVSHWLQLVNYETGKEVFKINEMVVTANAPVVIAIWESRLNQIKAKNPGEDIGWEHLLEVLNSPNGWADYSDQTDIRKKVYYGHTDPAVSSTALSTLISEYFASAKYLANDPNLEQLTIANVNDKDVQQYVREIENLIKHYSSRTTEFKEYIAQGPDYLDFVALEENDLIYINQGKTEYLPPEKLVALYPKEGTFIHEHPFAIPYADWVSDEQREAASVFAQYVTTAEVQKIVLESGFRPINSEVEVGYPIVTELGVDPDKPHEILAVPSPQTISAIQEDWLFVKKRSEIFLLVDTSGSMDGDKITNAKKAIRGFAESMAQDNLVGLVEFNDEVNEVVSISNLEGNRTALLSGVDNLYAEGGTALYRSLMVTLDMFEGRENSNTIKAIVLLSDGMDTDTENIYTLRDVREKLENLQKSADPILIIPIAYGEGYDDEALETIAEASSTRVQFGGTEEIEKLLEVISSYF